METNLDKNIESNNSINESSKFWHSGWPLLIFCVGLVGILILISNLIK